MGLLFRIAGVDFDLTCKYQLGKQADVKKRGSGCRRSSMADLHQPGSTPHHFLAM
jgi:hypothetical protein